MPATIRKIEPRDHDRWLELWEGYCRFYERTLSEPKTRHTWGLIMDATAPVHAIVAERAGDGVIGMANYIIHENTWELTPVCYLQDLFVAEGARNLGVGRTLIQAVEDRARAAGASRVYWLTHETNADARVLYDRLAERSGFIQYRKLF